MSGKTPGAQLPFDDNERTHRAFYGGRRLSGAPEARWQRCDNVRLLVGSEIPEVVDVIPPSTRRRYWAAQSFAGEY